MVKKGCQTGFRNEATRQLFWFCHSARRGRHWAPSQVVGEPGRGEICDQLQGAGLLEEVGGSGDDGELVFAGNSFAASSFRPRTCQSAPPTISSVGASTCSQLEPRDPVVPPGDHRADTAADLGGGAERGGGAGRGAEVPEGKIVDAGLALRPAGDLREALREQVDVEDLGAVVGLLVGQQIEQQRRKSLLIQRCRDLAVPGTEPAGPASVGEDHQARWPPLAPTDRRSGAGPAQPRSRRPA